MEVFLELSTAAPKFLAGNPSLSADGNQSNGNKDSGK
jgi:hypothetical protein